MLCDDSSDSTNLEQMISFIQFVDVDTAMVKTKFKFIANILEKLESPDAETICSVLLEALDMLHLPVVVVYPLPWPLLVGGVRCSRLWSTSQLLRPSGQQCSHSGGVCPQIQGRQCGAYVGAVEEMMCVVCVDVTEGA